MAEHRDGVLVSGTTFAGHRIEGIAGRGGMGVVYRATHLALDHVVALKLISPALAGDDRFRQRFQSESRIAVSIRHPNVVPVHHAGEEDGLLFVTMDFVEGTDLRGLLNRERRLDPERAAAILAPLASALDAAHARGLVHRDIKPGNVLIQDDGGHVYLTDFGLARAMDEASGLTQSGAFVGTLDYAAPEQIKGDRIDARTDVYALGCVLHEMLTGAAPFAHLEEKVAKLYAQLQEAPPSVRESYAELPEELERAVRRALSKDPDHRFPSAGDLARAVRAGGRGERVTEVERTVATGEAAPLAAPPTVESAPPTVETPPPTVETPPTDAAAATPPPAAARPRTTGRRPPIPLLAALAGLAAIAVVAVLVLSGGDESPAPSEGQPAASAGGGGGGGASAGDLTGARVAGKPIPVPDFPVGIAAGFGDVFVGTRLGGVVYRLDPQTQDLQPLAEGLAAPEEVTAGPGSVYVAVTDADTVVRIDPEDGSSSEIPVGAAPRAVVHADGEVWVTNSGEGTVTRVAVGPGSEEVLDDVPVGTEPHGIASGEGAIWVTNRGSGDVSRIDPGTEEATTIDVGANPKGIAVAEGRVWVANTDEDTVTPIDAATREPGRTLAVSDEPRGVAAGFDSVWVANGDGEVTRIDPRRSEVAETIRVGGSPEEVAVGDRFVYVSDGEGDAVHRITP